MSEKQIFDVAVIGGGIYGLYSGFRLGQRQKNTVILEADASTFSRASKVNQLRCHSGMHYLRSKETAETCIKYYQRFIDDFRFAINDKFEQIYAISADESYVNAEHTEKFCKEVNCRCDRIDHNQYFKEGSVEAAYITDEVAFDPEMIRDFFLEDIKKSKHLSLKTSFVVEKAEKVNVNGEIVYKITSSNGEEILTRNVINATYSSLNQIQQIFGFEKFKIKYELCEMIEVDVAEKYKKVGLTIMDGRFISCMPNGLKGDFTLSSVEFTPVKTCTEKLPKFDCQEKTNGACSENSLRNCSTCKFKPKTNFDKMMGVANKYFKDDMGIKYKRSLHTVKAVLLDSEKDDARPTVIKQFSASPCYFAVLSGKINTIYELDNILETI